MRYIHAGFQQPKINLIFREAKKNGYYLFRLLNFCLSGVAWSGFHWNHCYFSRLHWHCSRGLRPGWSRAHQGRGNLEGQAHLFCYCRAVGVFNVLPTTNGGTIELLYMQDDDGVTISPEHDESYDPSQHIISHGGVSKVQPTKKMMIFLSVGYEDVDRGSDAGLGDGLVVWL